MLSTYPCSLDEFVEDEVDAAEEVAVPEDVCEFSDEPLCVTPEPEPEPEPEPMGVVVVV